MDMHLRMAKNLQPKRTHLTLRMERSASRPPTSRLALIHRRNQNRLAPSAPTPYNHARTLRPQEEAPMTQYNQRLQAGEYAPPPTADELEEATVADLKEQLSARGLPTSGNKQELIDRLATPLADQDNE
jgi:hypothetical protein